ncbi:MAG: zf-HC2 domain-containing protein [Nitriliruptoraceae bacterium]|nr:zf-HC2 domain-containing protein [Nitriliruptoraceae bacterium]
MADGHAQYEELIVGHVLDDLGDADASRFRSHLMGCRDCRARVAELRGIAAELADVEREELARASLRTEVAGRVEDDDPGPGLPRIGIAQVTIAVIVVLLIAAAMGFWNLHLRAQAASYLAVAEARGETLDGLVRDTALPTEFRDGADGLVTGDGSRVSLAINGIPPLEDGELLVAWFLDVPTDEGDTEVTRLNVLRSDQRVDDTLGFTLEDPGGRELLVTREAGPTGTDPRGPTVVRVELPRDP